MNHDIVVNKLEKTIKTRRMITTLVAVFSFVLLIVFWVLYEKSRNVEEIKYIIGSYTKITYNYDYVWGIVIGFITFFTSVCVLISDFLFTKFYTACVGKEKITYYKGLLKTQLYINGEYRDGGIFNCYYLEGTLSDLTKVSVSVGKWNSCISFSNGYNKIEL